MRSNALRHLLLLSLVVLTLSAGTAAGDPLDASQNAEVATDAEVTEMLAVAEVTIARVSEQLHERIDRMGSDLFSHAGSRVPSGSRPTVQPVASRARGAGLRPDPEQPPRMLRCIVMPDRPLACQIAQARPR